MAQHGYLREYDEGWDRGDDRDRDDWRERSEWRGSGRDWRDRNDERNRGFMFRDEDRDYSRGGGRGFFSRMGDEARSWFRDDDREDRGAWENNRDWPQRNRGMSGYGRERSFGGSGEWREGQRRYSANPDDHYRSWRDRQMQALDRDYQDYCREREHQFHRDFDSWRQNRQQHQQQGSTGQQPQMKSQAQAGGSSEEVMELSNPQANDAGDTATTGRGRR